MGAEDAALRRLRRSSASAMEHEDRYHWSDRWKLARSLETGLIVGAGLGRAKANQPHDDG